MELVKSLTQQLHILGNISTSFGDNAHEQYEDFT